MHVYNEISLSLKEIGDISHIYSGRIFDLKTMQIMKYIILQSLRITKTLYLLQNNKEDLAIINSRFLRSERFEMRQNA